MVIVFEAENASLQGKVVEQGITDEELTANSS